MNTEFQVLNNNEHLQTDTRGQLAYEIYTMVCWGNRMSKVHVYKRQNVKTHQFLKTQDRFPAAKEVSEVVSATFL